MNQSLSIDDIILSDLERRINLSQSQADNYAKLIKENEALIEKLGNEIDQLKYELKDEQNYTLRLKSKHNTLSKQFSKK